jgi:hypothetical protein
MTTAMTQMINVAMKSTQMVAESRLESAGIGGDSPYASMIREAVQGVATFLASKATQVNPGQGVQPKVPKRAAQQPQLASPPATQVEPPVPVPPGASTVDQIVAAIKVKRNPTEVAQKFVDLVKNRDPAMVAAIEQAGNVNELVAQRLGPWAFQGPNLGYVRALFAEVQRIGFADGTLVEGDPDEADDSDNDEGADDNEQSEYEDVGPAQHVQGVTNGVTQEVQSPAPTPQATA